MTNTMLPSMAEETSRREREATRRRVRENSLKRSLAKHQAAKENLIGALAVSRAMRRLKNEVITAESPGHIPMLVDSANARALEALEAAAKRHVRERREALGSGALK